MSSSASPRRRQLASGAARAAQVAAHREQLRMRFPGTVDALHRRRADLVPEGVIADYVALNWLEWNGGALCVTLTGSNICKQMRAGLT
jgi:hypothetical protein